MSAGWQTLEKQKGIEVLKEACAACGEAITARKGRMIVKDEARVVRCLFWPKSIETFGSGRPCLPHPRDARPPSSMHLASSTVFAAGHRACCPQVF